MLLTGICHRFPEDMPGTQMYRTVVWGWQWLKYGKNGKIVMTMRNVTYRMLLPWGKKKEMSSELTAETSVGSLTCVFFF